MWEAVVAKKLFELPGSISVLQDAINSVDYTRENEIHQRMHKLLKWVSEEVSRSTYISGANQNAAETKPAPVQKKGKSKGKKSQGAQSVSDSKSNKSSSEQMSQYKSLVLLGAIETVRQTISGKEYPGLFFRASGSTTLKLTGSTLYGDLKSISTIGELRHSKDYLESKHFAMQVFAEWLSMYDFGDAPQKRTINFSEDDAASFLSLLQGDSKFRSVVDAHRPGEHIPTSVFVMIKEASNQVAAGNYAKLEVAADDEVAEQTQTSGGLTGALYSVASGTVGLLWASKPKPVELESEKPDAVTTPAATI